MAFSRLNNLVVHWSDAGPADRPAVLFGNSLGTDLRVWDDVTARLAPRWRIVTADKRGHGLTDLSHGPYSIDDLADDVLALADHRGIRRFAFVGLSIGGLVGQSLALKAPDRIAALVLSNTASRIGTAETWGQRIAAVEADGVASLADAVMQRWFTPRFHAERPVDLAGWRTMLMRNPDVGYAAACAAIRDADYTARLGRIATPTLVVAGDQDLSTPPDLVAATAAAITGARFKLIPDCGHIPPVEQPEALVALIERHLTECGHV